MAEEKAKPAGQPKDKAPAKPEPDRFIQFVQVLFVLFIISTIFTAISTWTQNDPLFQHGWSGVTAHNIVLDYTRPIASLANPIGATIVAIDDPTAVENDASGILVGYQKFGTIGTIIAGPVNVGGVNYYDVHFASPPDGWLAENRIAAQNGTPSVAAETLLIFWTIIGYSRILLWLIVICLIFCIVYLLRKLTAVRINNRELLYQEVSESSPQINPKWARVEAHLNSINQNDWRLAVIEADIMLSELLDTMHLPGDSIGDKLKGVEKSDFTTLDLAWEAHKVRNAIAHSGGDFHLSAAEAKRVVGLYEKVFREFQMI